MVDQLRGQYEAICAAAAADLTVVFDAGQNSEANFAHLAGTNLTALPASARAPVDQQRFGGQTAHDTRARPTAPSGA